MIEIYYTGADSYLKAQTDKDKSLGGYVSSSPVPNDFMGALFGDISNHSLDSEYQDTKAIVLKKGPGPTAAINIMTWFENLATQPFVQIEIASVALNSSVVDGNTVYYMEKIPNMRSTPTMATFYKPDTLAGAVNLGNIPQGWMLGIWLKLTILPNTKDNFYSTQALEQNGNPTEKSDKIIWHLDWT